jgi:hypothetical protein
VNAGQAFKVKLTMKNTGTTIWTASAPYFLGYFVTEPEEFSLPRSQVKPGESVTFTIPLTAPKTEGTYSFSGNMMATHTPGTGTGFGKQCLQNFTVVAPTQCQDGIDNDGDGNVDFPQDRGCKNAQDNNEGDGTTDIAINIVKYPTQVGPGAWGQMFLITVTNNGPDAVTTPIEFRTESTGSVFDAGLSEPFCTATGNDARCVINSLKKGEKKEAVLGYTFPASLAGTTVSTTAVVSETPQGDPNTKNNEKTVKTKVMLPPTFKVLSPNGGEVWNPGTMQTIRWKSTNVPMSSQEMLVLKKGGNTVYTLGLNRGGTQAITVPDDVGTGNDFKIEIGTKTGDGTWYSDESDSAFSIQNPIFPGPLNPSLDASTPASQTIQAGQKNVIFAQVKFSNDSDKVITNMDGLQIGSPTAHASDVLTNIRLLSNGKMIGSPVMELTDNGEYFYSWVGVSKFSIPTHSSKVITVVADVKSTASAGSVRLGIAGMNFAAPGCTSDGTLPVYGNAMTIPAAEAIVDGAITVTGPATILPSSTATYHITATNNGPSASFFHTLNEIPQNYSFNEANSDPRCALATDFTPPRFGCNFDKINPGQTMTADVTFEVAASAPADSVSTVLVTLFTPDHDTNTSNNLASASTTILSSPPTLNISVLSLPATLTAVTNQKNVTALRFEAAAHINDILLTKIVTTVAGPRADMQNYTLWADTDGNGVVDTKIQSGANSVPTTSNVVFDSIINDGYVIPKDQTVIFEVHADVGSTITDSSPVEVQLSSGSDYIGAEILPSGAPLTGISTNGFCDEHADFCYIFVTPAHSTLITLISKGNLYVTQDTTPTRSHQLLGGTLGDPILRINMRADNEPIDVTNLQFTSMNGNATSVDRLDLYMPGATTPFAAAYPSCGTDIIPSTGTTFCATMMSQQLVVDPSQADVKVLVRPRMKDDSSGDVSGDVVQFYLSGKAVMNNATGEGAVRAQGISSAFNLNANNGNSTADGEVFIGTATAAPSNADIVGKSNVTVLSKIASIVNANPDTNGTSLTMGQKDIALFQVSTLPSTNYRGGNRVEIATVLFSVQATNVTLDAGGFVGFNQANPTQVVLCYPMDVNGTALTGTVTGSFYVSCAFSGSPVDSFINNGEAATFGLRANIVNAGMGASSLQVSLQNFADSTLSSFSPSGYHFVWHDSGNMDDTVFHWVDYPDNTVNSTMYQN